MKEPQITRRDVCMPPPTPALYEAMAYAGAVAAGYFIRDMGGMIDDHDMVLTVDREPQDGTLSKPEAMVMWEAAARAMYAAIAMAAGTH